MKRVFAALVALCLSISPAVAQLTNVWTPVADAAKRSIVVVQSVGGSCTGFIINAAAKGGPERHDDVDYILTAAHCDGADLYASQRPATIKTKDARKDLMVLEVEDLDRPALKIAKADPVPGDEIASFGYGYGLEEPMFRVANVANDKLFIPFEGVGGPLIAVNMTFVPGQSGGPVLNHSGEVVMIVQMGTPIVGFGVGVEIIRDRVGRYVGK